MPTAKNEKYIDHELPKCLPIVPAMLTTIYIVLGLKFETMIWTLHQTKVRVPRMRLLVCVDYYQSVFCRSSLTIGRDSHDHIVDVELWIWQFQYIQRKPAQGRQSNAIYQNNVHCFSAWLFAIVGCGHQTPIRIVSSQNKPSNCYDNFKQRFLVQQNWHMHTIVMGMCSFFIVFQLALLSDHVLTPVKYVKTIGGAQREQCPLCIQVHARTRDFNDIVSTSAVRALIISSSMVNSALWILHNALCLVFLWVWECIGEIHTFRMHCSD